jgi:hypothetical protein
LMRGCGHGSRQDALPTASRAMHAWQSGMPVGPLMTMFPFLCTNEYALAFERSELTPSKTDGASFELHPSTRSACDR